MKSTILLGLGCPCGKRWAQHKPGGRLTCTGGHVWEYQEGKASEPVRWGSLPTPDKQGN